MRLACVVVVLCVACTELPQMPWGGTTGVACPGCAEPPPCQANHQACGGTDDTPAACCAPGASCIAGACSSADLALDASAVTLKLLARTYASDACAVTQGCVLGAGPRQLLDMAVQVHNTSDVALSLDGRGAALLSPRACGVSERLENFLGWTLVRSGAEVRSGRIATECLGGTEDDSALCLGQVLAAGASVEQPQDPGCGVADLTGLEPGEYLLHITVNPDGTIPESNRDNNTITLPFTMPEHACTGSICGGVCCPEAYQCVDGQCGLPDLELDVPALQESIFISEAQVDAQACVVQEQCVGGPGRRRLLRFTTSTANVGEADLFIGDPRGSDEFEWSQCHGHFHHLAFADYRLYDAQGNLAARGHKQSFCLEDTAPLTPDAPPGQYTCEYQGITRGWRDTYLATLDCQWVDITDVPPGEYALEVVINPEQLLPEHNFANNRALLPVTIPPPAGVCYPQDEVCGDGIDQDCDGEADDGCAPLVGLGDCTNAHPVAASALLRAELDTPNMSLPASVCGATGGAAHFLLQLDGPEVVYLSSYGSEMDTTLSVMNGACGSEELACSDDQCGTQQSHFVARLQAGVYGVVVRAKDPQASGLVQLKVVRSGCDTTRTIVAPGSYEGDTSTLTHVQPTACGEGAGPEDFWYFTTCPGSTNVSFNTCTQTVFDSVLQVLEGSCSATPSHMLCNDDSFPPCNGSQHGSRLEASVQGTGAGDGLWFIQVDGFRPESSGAYTLQADIALP